MERVEQLKKHLESVHGIQEIEIGTCTWTGPQWIEAHQQDHDEWIGDDHDHADLPWLNDEPTCKGSVGEGSR